MGIKTIIRLNKPKYNKKIFIKAGIKHFDLFYTDGTTPSVKIINSFFKIVEESKGAVAIHCKAGLGRTGTLIALYLMKEYKMCAADCIAWLRILRPGSILGPQQHFLLKNQEFCFDLSKSSKNFNSFSENNKNLCKIFIKTLSQPKSIKNLKNFKFKSFKNQGDFLLKQKLTH